MHPSEARIGARHCSRAAMLEDGTGPSSAPLAGASSTCSTATEWSPEAHSWILVPEALAALSDAASAAAFAPPLAGPGIVGISDLASVSTMTGGALAPDESVSGLAPPAPAPAAVVSPSPSPPLRSPTLSPKNLSASLLHEGETVAALAVSELLTPEMLGAESPLASSTTSHDAEPAPTSAPRKLGALAYPPVQCALCGALTTPRPRPSEKGEEGAEGVGPSLALVDTLAPLLSRPLPLVAVLLASHAAAVLLGVVIGRAVPAHVNAALVESNICLARRFSSGPYGTHARLAYP